MAAAVSRDVVDRILDRVHDGDRDRHPEVLGRPVLVLCRNDAAPTREVERALVGADLDPRRLQRRDDPRKEAVGDAAVDEELLRRIAHAGPLDLRVEHDRFGLVEVGARVDVDVAVPGRGIDHGDARNALERRLQLLAASRDDEVHGVALAGELGELLAPAALHEHDRPVRQALGGRRVRGDARQHLIGVARARGAAQHDRVARLHAQRGRVDRDVRPCLVDHRDHAEWHPLLAHVETVRQAPAFDHLAHGVRQSDDLPHGPRDAREAIVVQAQPVEQRIGELRSAARLEITLVSGQDLARVLLEAPRHRLERGVLDVGGDAREGPRGLPCGAAELGDRVRVPRLVAIAANRGRIRALQGAGHRCPNSRAAPSPRPGNPGAQPPRRHREAAHAPGRTSCP